MKAILIKREDGYNLGIEQPQGRLLEATCSPSQQLILNKSGASTKYKLSKQNCDEIFGVIDSFYESISKLNTSYLKGFNKAMELNKDKQFTIEDMKRAFIAGSNFTSPDEVVLNETFGQSMNRLIKSLQQPTEIEVEIEMEKVVNETKVVGAIKGVKGSGDKITTYKSVPKLDADGCLILKKV
jgi:MinD superfamily P-loop ATPase